MKNPQTTIALTFLTHIISDIDGVYRLLYSNQLSLKVGLLIGTWATVLFESVLIPITTKAKD